MSAQSKILRAPKPTKLRGRILTTAEIEGAIAWGRE